MAVTIAEVERIAALAHLDFSAEEKEQFLHHFNEILAYMEKIAELDLTKVEPTTHLTAEMPLREDEIRPGLLREEALANAPAAHDGYFSVPKVIGGQSDELEPAADQE